MKDTETRQRPSGRAAAIFRFLFVPRVTRDPLGLQPVREILRSRRYEVPQIRSVRDLVAALPLLFQGSWSLAFAFIFSLAVALLLHWIFPRIVFTVFFFPMLVMMGCLAARVDMRLEQKERDDGLGRD